VVRASGPRGLAVSKKKWYVEPRSLKGVDTGTGIDIREETNQKLEAECVQGVNWNVEAVTTLGIMRGIGMRMHLQG